MSARRSLAGAIALLFAVLGCQPIVELGPAASPLDTRATDTGDDTSWPSDVASVTDTGSATATTTAEPPTGCTAMDILFIIDDSHSMSCEQESLGLSFPQFIEVLEHYSNEAASQLAWRVGVTTTGRTVWGTFKNPPLPEIPFNEKGLDGRLVSAPGTSEPWLDGPDPLGWVAERFAQMALVGTAGPTYEMPLACLKLAVEKATPGGENEGFLREGALFVVVIITDEDDCSRPDGDNGFDIPNDDCMSNPTKHNLVPLEDYRAFLDTRFGPERYVVVVIAGAQRCQVSTAANCFLDDPTQAGAYEAQRLTHFAKTTITPNSVFTDICTEDFPSALEQALATMQVVCDDFAPQ